MTSRSPLASTFGMFILDEFRYEDIHQGSNDISDAIERPRTLQIGGGGTYAIIGARMFLPPQKLLMFVDRGSDWDTGCQGVGRKLEEYGNETWVFNDDQTRETTRALNIYRSDGSRGFQYLTSRLRLSPNDFINRSIDPPLSALPKYLHFVCSPTRASEIIQEIDLISSSQKWKGWVPKLVYEPIPDLCVPSELDMLTKVMPRIDIFSPNHLEAVSFFNDLTHPPMQSKEFEAVMDEVTERFVKMGSTSKTTSQSGFVIIRCGEYGSFVRSQEGEKRWIKPYWTTGKIWTTEKETGKKVVTDVTGAGNSFLGGLMGSLARQEDNGEKIDIFDAAKAGSVASSFIIQQYGLPSLTKDDVTGEECWGDVEPRSAKERLKEMRERLSLPFLLGQAGFADTGSDDDHDKCSGVLKLE